MHHLILGYGYCGYYLAQELLTHGAQVTTVSRHVAAEMQLEQVTHLFHDLAQPFEWHDENTIVYYLIPPPATGKNDLTLQHLLKNSQIKCRKVIYFGSSGVYGEHNGAWVNEESVCFITNDRQARRLDAEQQWVDYCKQHHNELAILRIAGIYGPNRLPIAAAEAQTPLISEEQAPYTNHIYVKDLASIAYRLGQMDTKWTTFNIADGKPNHMGTLQKLVAKALDCQPALTESWQDAWDRATPMKREFMANSKLLDIARLQKTLGINMCITPLLNGINQSVKCD